MKLLGTIDQKQQPEEVSGQKIYVAIGNIAALLTAFKVGRHDLITAPGALRRFHGKVPKSNFFGSSLFHVGNPNLSSPNFR